MEIGELTEYQIQELAGVLEKELGRTDITDAAHLADATQWDKRSTATEEPRLIEFLRHANHSDDLQDVLSALIYRADIGQDHSLANELNEILTGTSVVIENTSQGYELVSKTTEYAKEMKNQHRTYIENNAPMRVVARLDRAHVLLTEGDHDNALQDCRRALENMTKTGEFGWALEQLYDQELIQKDTTKGDREPKDREIAKDAYNYLSNVGSHAGANSPPANSQQAELGFMYTQEVIVFLLRAIEQGEQNDNLELDRWAT